jgi:hypothetical protein
MLHNVEKEDLVTTKAHKVDEYPFGLFSVAGVSEYTEAQDHWARYTAHEFNSGAFRSTLLSTYDQTAATLYNGIGNARYLEYIPFGIEVEDFSSTFSLLAQDRPKRALDILEAITQKSIERELWSGDCAKIGSGTTGSPVPNANNYLTKQSASTNITVTSAGDSTRLALANLEKNLAACPIGGRGTIHMSRKTASIMSGLGLLIQIDFSARLDKGDVNAKKQALVTQLGTPVVVGSGYTGDGPVGATGASATAGAEWMFGTGYVDAHLGAKKVINEDLSRAIVPNTNDVHIRAARTAAVHFEPCCHYAVRVDLTTINNF